MSDPDHPDKFGILPYYGVLKTLWLFIMAVLKLPYLIPVHLFNFIRNNWDEVRWKIEDVFSFIWRYKLAIIIWAIIISAAIFGTKKEPVPTLESVREKIAILNIEQQPNAKALFDVLESKLSADEYTLIAEMENTVLVLNDAVSTRSIMSDSLEKDLVMLIEK